MKKSQPKRPPPRTAKELLAERAIQAGGVPPWQPPEAVVSELDEILRANAADPARPLGSLRIQRWLESDYGVVIGRTALDTYLRRRRIALGLRS